MEDRLIELEIRQTYADDLLEVLNATIFRQQQDIERLQREMQALREQLRAAAPERAWALRDELPPHY